MSKQLLVGLCGPAGCGKDTVASFMPNFQRYALASPIKLALEVMFGFDPAIWDDRQLKETVVPWLGKSPRQLAQTLGTEWGRHHVDHDLWLKLGMRQWDLIRSGANPRLVITDVRFDNEAIAIINAGGTVWRVDREGVAPVATHVSEKGISPQLITGSVKNYGDLDQLRRNVTEWVHLLGRRYAK
jgi:hypothetical protein